MNFRFLEKFEQVFIVLCGPHFPHSEPFIDIVSFNFKLAPYSGADWGYEPLVPVDRSIRHFKNISRKVYGGHCFLY